MRLPAEARCWQAPDAPIERWDAVTELLAQIVELLSVTATGGAMVLRTPVEVPRPEHLRMQLEEPAPQPTTADVVSIKALLDRRRERAWGQADTGGSS